MPPRDMNSIIATNTLTPYVSSPLKTTRHTKSVSFNSAVRAKKYVHLTDFSDEEIQQAWYTNQDMQEMRNQARFVANLFQNGLLEHDSHDYCQRGVEKFMQDFANHETQTHRRAMIQAVLHEQNLQRNEGSYDPDFIAELSASLTQSAHSKAMAVGLNDQLEAKP